MVLCGMQLHTHAPADIKASVGNYIPLFYRRDNCVYRTFGGNLANLCDKLSDWLIRTKQWQYIYTYINVCLVQIGQQVLCRPSSL